MRLLCLFLIGLSASAASVFTTQPDDPKAIVVSGHDGAAVQAAIDKAAASNTHEGIVFVPSGHYAFSQTVYVWPGVRLFGIGQARPVFVLPENTAGFQKGLGVMVMFTGGKPGHAAVPPQGAVPPSANIPDANSGTFYSAISNVDFEIGDGNSAAVGIRFHVAQHAFLTHMDFHIGSGLAAVYQVGNEAEDLHFYGGRYAILSEKTSPAWQFTLLDSTFEGQKEAAIREHEAGLTLVRDSFRNVPVAIDIDPQYSDELWVKDCRFESIAKAAVVISNEKSARTEIGFQNAVLQGVPTFALLRESGKKVAGKGSSYAVKEFNYGLMVPALGSMGEMGMRYEASALQSMPAPLPSAIRALPGTEEWVNVHTLGVAGDGTTDDTAAIQKAIETHKVLYFPSGHYVVRDTLALKPDSVLIGLHPTLTQFDLPDGTAAYQGVGAPKPVLFAPQGGTNTLSGFGVMAGGVNARAVSVLWSAGENSLIDDVRFLGGHGSGTNPYNNNQTADPDLHKRWDSQYPSLWVTHGGGGAFADIWTPDTFAQAGIFVSDTKTPGHVYELSAEHHLRNEIKFDHVENWDVNAPQTEEEAGESGESLSLELDYSKNITIANYHAYRVTRSRMPYPAAVRLYHSTGIHFRNLLTNAESGFSTCDEKGCGTYLRVSKYPYENAIEDVTHHLQVREREFAVLDVDDKAERVGRSGTSGGAKQLETGFFSIGGATVDANGKLYFVDRHQQQIYGWSETEGLTVERDSPLDAVNLGIDEAGNLMVVSSAGAEGTVYSFRPGSPKDEISLLSAEPAKACAECLALLPVNYWNNGEFRDQLDVDTLQFKTLPQMFAEDVSTPKAKEFVSLDGKVLLPEVRVWKQGPADTTAGWRFSDNLDTVGFLRARVGERVYVSSSSEDVTYSAKLGADGTLTDLQPFAHRGGESVAVDADGNVFVANGQIFVYNSSGKQIGLIDVPERPLQLVFGGRNKRTLFALAHHSLYRVNVVGMKR
ncbi:MAG: glycosyl hydrolase family 28-related protein [Bryobacteraceae bacterium]